MCSQYNQLFLSFAILLSIENVVSNDLHFDQIVNLKNSGGIGCLLAVTPEVETCKGKYTARVSEVVQLGHSMQSEEYRKAYCCGFWSLRDCVADSARQKCDKMSAKTMSNMKIFSTEQENVFYKNCDGFEYGSKQCGSASIQTISLWTLITGLSISLLIRR